MKHLLVLDYDTIFENEEPLAIEEYLNGVSKAQLQLAISYFLGIDFMTSYLNDWRELLKMWFRQENRDFANIIWHRCEALERQYGQITFLRTAAFLKFFEFTKDYQELPNDVDEATAEKNLFIVYLLFLSKTTDKETISSEYIKALPEGMHLPALIVNQQFAYGEYSNVHLMDVFKAQVIKACYLFMFLERSQTGSYLLQAFCNFYHLKHWKEFFQFIVPIIQGHALHPKGGGWTHLNVVKNQDFEKNCFFLESLAKEVDIESDFRSIRANPLYKVKDGVFGIIYPLFVIEKIFKGSYFKLKELNDAITNEEVNKINDWKRFYTESFSESELLYKVLDHIYGERSYKKFSGDILKHIDKAGPPDYYIRNGNTLYLFENKDIFINGDIRQSYDYAALEAALKEKLYFATQTKKDGSLRVKPKAVKQLARNVQKALMKENSFDTKYKEQNLKIYPILVLHDASFDCPGLNKIVNFWFDEEMQELEASGLSVKNVRHITMINIDTFLLYADYLKQKVSELDDLIDGYIKNSTFTLKKSPQTQSQLQERYSSTLEPFSNFIDQSTNTGFQKVQSVLAETMIKEISSINPPTI